MKYIKGSCMREVFLLLILSFGLVRNAWSSELKTIAFYNVENLFDTVNHPKKADDDFLPKGKKAWSLKRYWIKINQLAKVIERLGDQDGPEVLGLCEVENKNVLEDLINVRRLKTHAYYYVHYDSQDHRGIDTALLYKTNVWTKVYSKVYNLAFPFEKNYTSRDILEVGLKDLKHGNMLYVLVNHWPSRRGGLKKSEPRRMVASKKVKDIMKSIYNKNPKANIICMGDFNDESNNKSIRELIGSLDRENVNNPLIDIGIHLKKQNKGTYKYKNKWNLLDHIFVTQTILSRNNKGVRLVGRQRIFSPKWIQETKHPKYLKTPRQTFAGRYYLGGYSDHFPVYIHYKVK